MLEWTEYAKIVLALLVIVNPVGAVPLFASLTSDNSDQEKKRIARIASTAVAVVLIVAAVGGQPLLALFGITIASFKVGGAILILLIAIAMMHGEQTGEKQMPDEAREAVYKERIAVVPLAIPLLSGPGAISTIIIYATARSSVGHLAAIIACAVLVALVTWIALRVATPVST